MIFSPFSEEPIPLSTNQVSLSSLDENILTNVLENAQ